LPAALAHELPGRLRFSLRSLRRDSRRAAAVRDRLVALPGVVTASASPLTGSVLVTYEGGVVTRERIVRTIERSGFVLTTADTALPAPSVRPAVRERVAHPIVQVAVEKLLEHLLTVAIAAVS
jgi:hypothetical protein